jgi:hypothetical protein
MTSTDAKNKVRQRARVTVAGDGMSATLVLFRPAADEDAVSVEEVMEEVERAGLVHGVNEDLVKKLVVEENYNNPTTIAEGTRPIKGENSQFTYHFDTSNKHTPKEDEDGRIDYKDISFIQNIDKGAVMVTKTPPTEGEPGKTVTGKDVKAPVGRDIPFNKGANTHVSEDGLTLFASASGAIVYLHGKVSVNDLTIINGDVDYSVGNINCKGSVRVCGDIKAGFNLTIDGDLEVNGHVEDCSIDVGGNISVKSGFFGKGEGRMQAGGDVTLKYVEGQKVISGGNIYVGGEIINCNLTAKDKVIVRGRKGKIVGGDIKAGREIRASVLGADVGTATHLYAGYDAEIWRKYHEVRMEIKRLTDDGERVKAALYNLYRLQMTGKLPDDKKLALEELQKFRDELPGNMEILKNRKAELEEKMQEYRDSAIIAEKKMYPGVVGHFGIIYYENLEERLACKMIPDGYQVALADYKGGEE